MEIKNTRRTTRLLNKWGRDATAARRIPRSEYCPKVSPNGQLTRETRVANVVFARKRMKKIVETIVVIDGEGLVPEFPPEMPDENLGQVKIIRVDVPKLETRASDHVPIETTETGTDNITQSDGPEVRTDDTRNVICGDVEFVGNGGQIDAKAGETETELPSPDSTTQTPKVVETVGEVNPEPRKPTISKDERIRGRIDKHLSTIEHLHYIELNRRDRQTRENYRLGEGSCQSVITPDVIIDCLGEGLGSRLLVSIDRSMDLADFAEMDLVQARILKVLQLVMTMKCFSKNWRDQLKKSADERIAQFNGTTS